MLTQIHEYKGEQTLFIQAKADTLTQLVAIAKSKVQKRLIKLREYALLITD